MYSHEAPDLDTGFRSYCCIEPSDSSLPERLTPAARPDPILAQTYEAWEKRCGSRAARTRAIRASC